MFVSEHFAASAATQANGQHLRTGYCDCNLPIFLGEFGGIDGERGKNKKLLRRRGNNKG